MICDVDDEEFDGEDDFQDGKEISLVLEPASWRSAALLLFEMTAFATSYFTVLRTTVAVMSRAKWGACIGGVSFGTFGVVAQVVSSEENVFRIAPRLRKGFAGVVGLISGAVLGGRRAGIRQGNTSSSQFP